MVVRIVKWGAPWALALAVACSSGSGDDGQEPPPGPGSCGADVTSFRFPDGGDGHADPFGAKVAKQARAGRIKDASSVMQPQNGRSRIRSGDFVLANEKIAIYIGQESRGDGYVPFGGKVLAIEPVGDDGKPRGLSQYGESLLMFGIETIHPQRVSVLADGSDGKEAIVRAEGVLEEVPFLHTFKNLLSPNDFRFPVAFDYVLAPGAEKMLLRVTFVNTQTDDVDLSLMQNLGMFHDYRMQTFTEGNGFDKPHGDVAFVGFDGPASFLVRAPQGTLKTGIGVSGFQLFTGKGPTGPACKQTTFDFAEMITGGPEIDGLLEAKRRVNAEPAWRELRGTVAEAPGGAPIAGAQIHATSADGKYLTRVTADDKGAWMMHVPAGAVSLTPTMQGYEVPAAKAIGDGDTSVALTLPQAATLVVDAKDATTSESLPVRVQVVPQKSPAPAPPSFGVKTDEPNGRLYQSFATTGSATLRVPAGSNRVIVTRGYEYEVFDATVDAVAGQSTPVAATIAHTVDSTGIMCADFHIHSHFSVDAHDTVLEKVTSAIADGLDIPVSSEHEWVIDFQPIIEQLGLTKWAYGFPSEELTTFEFGHFGVVPMRADGNAPNMGAVDWIGKKAPALFHDVKTRPENPALIINHPSGGDFQAYFSSTSFDRATAKGVPDQWSEEFDAVEVFNGSDLESNRDKSLADWFALLNAGKNFSAVGNSDSHHIKSSPVGYPRTCFWFGHDDPTKLSAEIVRDAVKSGASTISGGLMITKVEGPGGVRPGGKATAGSYTLSIASPSWIQAATLEVIVDGQTSKTLPLTPTSTTPGNRYDVTVDVQPSSSAARHWVVFHAKGAQGKDLSPLHPGNNPFAVSNPIFF
jgi:hypothetical protein